MKTEMFRTFDGVELALHRHGRGRPVILLHGLFSSAAMNWVKWGHHERIAAQGFEVLMPDLRAHGDSAAPVAPEHYPQNVLVEDLKALIEGLGLTEFDLGGFSLGARTTLHAVATGAVAPARIVVAGMGVAGLSDWHRRAAFFRRVIDEFDTIRQGDPAWFARSFLKSQGIDRTAARLLLGTMADLDQGLLPNITAPALVVCGTDDHDNGSAEELAAALPHARYAPVPGTHMSSVTMPAFGDAMAQWLGAGQGGAQ